MRFGKTMPRRSRRAACGASGWVMQRRADLAMGGGLQHDIIRLNARELFEHGSWGIAEASAALPHLEALPQHEGEKADKDMCLHTILALVPDRRLRTVLSVTTMFADKPHRLNVRTSAQRFRVLTILPPVTALAVGLPAQRAIAQRFRALAPNGHAGAFTAGPL